MVIHVYSEGQIIKFPLNERDLCLITNVIILEQQKLGALGLSAVELLLRVTESN